MELRARCFRGDREGWSLRAYVRLTAAEGADLSAACSGVDRDGYVDTAEEWERREAARDAANSVFSVAGVRPAGGGSPGGWFAGAPCLRIVGRRAFVYQCGGLDI